MLAMPDDHTVRFAPFHWPATEIVDDIVQATGRLPQISIEYEDDIKTLWITICPQPKPVFTIDVLNSINKVQRAIHSLWGPHRCLASPVRFLAYKARGAFFTLGGDLDFYLDCLATNDRAGLEEYARVTREAVIWNASSLRGTAITMTTVHAKALGGGIDAARSCNVMIAERRATFRYPEINFNHFPITAVALLSRCIGSANALKILTSGAEYTADEFAAFGSLDAVVDDGEGEKWLREHASQNLRTHSARLALFDASYQQSAASLEAELSYLAQRWADCMMRMPPVAIANLQRISTAQERMLLRESGAKSKDRGPPVSP